MGSVIRVCFLSEVNYLGFIEFIHYNPRVGTLKSNFVNKTTIESSCMCVTHHSAFEGAETRSKICSYCIMVVLLIQADEKSNSLVMTPPEKTGSMKSYKLV